MNEPVRPIVSVKASSTLEVPPDLATVYVAISTQAKSRADALRTIVAETNELKQALRTYPVEKLDDGAASIQILTKGKKVTGCVAALRLAVTLADFAALGDLVLRIGEREFVALSGPFWSLRPEHPGYLEAKREAIGRARATAEAYAEAAGGRLTGLLEIADEEAVSASSRPPYDRPRGGGARGGSSVADESEFDLTPVPQRITASVVARYAMTAPPFPPG